MANTKQMPAWATKVLAVLALAADYVVHHAQLIPAGYHIGPVSVLGAANDVLLLVAMVGINGPQLMPRVAAWLGNPPGTPTAPPSAPPPA